MKRIGKDVDARDRWKDQNASYANTIESPYHVHRAAVIKKLIAELPMSSALCIDVGCGEGIFLELLASRGASVIGFDPNARLVDLARSRLSKRGLEAEVRVGGLEVLERMEASAGDHLMAFNVIAYFTEEEEKRFYQEAWRVLKDGGNLVVTHSNELFDLFTLNAFTVEFFVKSFCGEACREQIASLVTHPNQPDRLSYNVRENPLTYRAKLGGHGFEEVQQEFINLHRVPPLLMDPEVFVDIDKKEYPDTLGWEAKERWKLMFLCSMFGSRSVKRNGGR
jgi:2-polyprenyl-3-methyl-5-hydroxy-6-metoxy-1,4-benzoquinol methylase